MIASYNDYRSALNTKDISEQEYDWYAYNAEKTIKDNTTGVDGFSKLDEAFPDTESAEVAVKRCFCELVSLYYSVDQVKANIEQSAVIKRTDGTISSGIVQSVSSGAESMTFGSMSGALATDTLAAASDRTMIKNLERQIIKNHLTNVKDRNGCNLLYMGAYPYV